MNDSPMNNQSSRRDQQWDRTTAPSGDPTQFQGAQPGQVDHMGYDNYDDQNRNSASGGAPTQEYRQSGASGGMMLPSDGDQQQAGQFRRPTGSQQQQDPNYDDDISSQGRADPQFGQGQGQGQAQGGNFDNYDDSDGSNVAEQGRGTGKKPGMGQKVMGTMEMAAGKVTHNPGMVEKGGEKKTGQF